MCGVGAVVVIVVVAVRMCLASQSKKTVKKVSPPFLLRQESSPDCLTLAAWHIGDGWAQRHATWLRRWLVHEGSSDGVADDACSV